MAGKFMLKEIPVQIERGRQFMKALNSLKTFSSQIKHRPVIEGAEWLSFVTFPKEITKLIPNTEVSPEMFLMNLGHTSINGIESAKRALLGPEVEKYDETVYPFEIKPVFSYKKEGLSLKVLNGATNSHALKMSEAASHGFGFDNSYHRAVYQNAMGRLAKNLVKTKYDTETAGLVIRDDCGASADSIIGYLTAQLQNPAGEEQVRQGVRVDLIAATAQSVLLLKKFAEVMGFPLEIHAGHMAFGLTEHNYITYPNELLESGSIPEKIVERLKRYRYQEDGNIYVVGEMGNAQKGLSEEEMRELGMGELLDDSFYQINNERTDPHGNHPNRQEHVIIKNPQEYGISFVYFARGGYLLYAIDKKFNPDFKRARSIVLRASRKEVEGQYGVAFNKE